MSLLAAVANAWKLPDLRRKLLFTLGALVVFRFVTHIPLPGVTVAELGQLTGLFQGNPILSTLDLFSGGALRQFSIAAMGVYPYITAQIIVTLLTPIVPRLSSLSKEGEAGRNRLNQYTHWLRSEEHTSELQSRG